MSGIGPGHAAFADRLARAMGRDELADALASIRRLSAVLDQLADEDEAGSGAVTDR